MVGADVLLLLDSPGHRVGVPAKLYEFVGAGRPILALAEFDSDVAWVLRESEVPHRDRKAWIAKPSGPHPYESSCLSRQHRVVTGSIIQSRHALLVSNSQASTGRRAGFLVGFSPPTACERSLLEAAP